MIEIDPESSVPPFEQVRASIAAQIGDHTLAVGTRLPTVRALAAELGIAVNTVARSYRELEQAGLIETRGKAGTYVSARADRVRAKVLAAARDYAAAARAAGLSQDEAMRIVDGAFGEAS